MVDWCSIYENLNQESYPYYHHKLQEDAFTARVWINRESRHSCYW